MHFINELIFIIHTFIIGGFALGSLALGKQALVAFVCVQCMLANLFVIKQTTLFGFAATTADAFTIGATLGLNLLQEYFGKKITRKTIWINFFLLIFFVIVSQIHILYIPNQDDWAQDNFISILQFAPRIVVASLSVYLITHLTDYYLYGFLKRNLQNRLFIIRNYASIGLSQFLDTFLFSFLGLYGIIENIWSIIFISYMIKLVSIIIATPFVYFSHRIYKNTNQEDNTKTP